MFFSRSLVHSCNQLGSKSFVTSKRFISKRVSVILQADIPGYVKGQEASVALGYARNHLIPSKKAVYYTPENRAAIPMPDMESINKRKKEEELKEATKRLSKITVSMKRAVLPNGSLHAPVTKKNIIEKTFNQHKIQLTEEQVNLSDPITSLGPAQVPIRIEGLLFPLNVNVEKR